MVIIDELPFRFVEGYGFQRYSTTLQPKLRIRDIPSHHTVARDVIGIYGVEREKLRGALKGRRVCLLRTHGRVFKICVICPLQVILLMMIGSFIREF